MSVCKPGWHSPACNERHTAYENTRWNVNPRAGGAMDKRTAAQKLLAERNARNVSNPQRFMSATDTAEYWRAWRSRGGKTIAEIERYRPVRNVKTIYIGGGSPSCLPREQLFLLIDEINNILSGQRRKLNNSFPETPIQKMLYRRTILF